MTRYEQAVARIQEAHEMLPSDISLKDRRKAIDAAYPFGIRAYSPYKAWLKARRSYLIPYGHKPRNAPHETQMERMMRKTKEKVGDV